LRKFRWVLLVIVCLGVTGSGAGWADPAHVDWVEDPYAPHVTRGTTVRLGTAVGFLYRELVDVTALGESLLVVLVVGLQIFDDVDRMLETDEALMCPGVDVHVHGNTEPIERVGAVLALDDSARQLLGDWAGGTANATAQILFLVQRFEVRRSGFTVITGKK
jgi:hypothetical protein